MLGGEGSVRCCAFGARRPAPGTQAGCLEAWCGMVGERGGGVGNHGGTIGGKRGGALRLGLAAVVGGSLGRFHALPARLPARLPAGLPAGLAGGCCGMFQEELATCLSVAASS